MSTDLEELRARIQAIAAKRPAPRDEPAEPRGKPSWSGPQGGAHMISTHDHFGYMRRVGSEQWCDREAGGCGQEWVLLVDGDRPPRLYARPYRGSYPALPYGSTGRGG